MDTGKLHRRMIYPGLFETVYASVRPP
jgi:hypothetical protein